MVSQIALNETHRSPLTDEYFPLNAFCFFDSSFIDSGRMPWLKVLILGAGSPGHFEQEEVSSPPSASLHR